MNVADNDEPPEMHREVDWLKPSDRPILTKLAEFEGNWIKPASLALNVPYSRYTVATRLSELNNRGLVERIEEDTAAYRISGMGREFLNDGLSVDDLRNAGEYAD